MNTIEQYKNPWWLSNKHLMTVLSSISGAAVDPRKLRWETLELPDGDFIDLCWAGNINNPLVVMLHGMEGCVESTYIYAMLRELVDHDYQVVVMNFRTCSYRDNRLCRAYHPGDTSDLSFLIHVLAHRLPNIPLNAIGFSLGGCMLLNYLAMMPINPLQKVVTVSAPYDVEKTLRQLPYMYDQFMLHSMKRKAINKIKQGFDIGVTIREIKKIKTIHEYTVKIMAPMHGFKRVEDYYKVCSCRKGLKDIITPTLIVQAEDDPFIPAETIPSKDELSEHVKLEITPKGGHVGFVNGGRPWKPKYWVYQRARLFLDTGT